MNVTGEPVHIEVLLADKETAGALGSLNMIEPILVQIPFEIVT